MLAFLCHDYRSTTKKPPHKAGVSQLSSQTNRSGLDRNGSLGDLSEVRQGTDHVGGEAVLVVVEGHGASQGHAINGVDVGLGRVEHATVGVAEDVGGDDALIVVAVVIGVGEGLMFQ